MKPKDIAHLGEFSLISHLSDVIGPPHSQDIICGVGDDAAVYRIGGGQVHVVSTDALVDGYHFDIRFASWSDVGFKAMAVNISDIVAMNAAPRYATVAIGLPPNFLVTHIEDIYKGLHQCAVQYGVDMIGGDTTRSDRVMLSITVIGEAAEKEIVYRSGGAMGDVLCVTGTLGGALAGLEIARSQSENQTPDYATADKDAVDWVSNRLRLPTPRTDVLKMWKDADVRPTALIDISDGLAAELHHLCSASQCGAIIRQSALPVAPAVRALTAGDEVRATNLALKGGDEYELLFAIPEFECHRMDTEMFTVIGSLTPNSGVRMAQPGDQGTTILNPVGHDHFAPQ